MRVFEGLKKGDKVYLVSVIPLVKPRVAYVTEVDAKYFQAEGLRFRLRDGGQSGGYKEFEAWRSKVAWQGSLRDEN
jgi:hypothetical protein